MSHTRFIKEPEKPLEIIEQPIAAEPAAQAQATEKAENDVTIDLRTLKQFKILARYQNEPVEILVNKALEHFLRLKSLQLEQAIQKLTEEE